MKTTPVTPNSNRVNDDEDRLLLNTIRKHKPMPDSPENPDGREAASLLYGGPSNCRTNTETPHAKGRGYYGCDSEGEGEEKSHNQRLKESILDGGDDG